MSEGFVPRPRSPRGDGDWLADETRAIVRTRLREMAVIYALIFGMFVILRPFLLGLPTASISTPFWGANSLAGVARGLSLESAAPCRTGGFGRSNWGW